jgi:hypothetical protein
MAMINQHSLIKFYEDSDMQDILKKVHAHMPYHLLPDYLETILKRKLNLEIYFSHYVLQNLDRKKCAEVAKILADAGCALYGFTSRGAG